ncbi:GntR family transcriptional regulator [Amycolatopsis acidiphila]|uniref:GntR family transcriptional regulator n=1 Tax=Amycolatopsis acidiphila TaxID=715473 RepID=A0A557ZST4_9PSEU|nr:GntR family transcriptional regulator [Amycolatopsis acidiphila]TVT15074.1 GntR family transcriptional regulator [Amycolatopsis acidiphila]UIJ63928.1 GntR family transcriptional regulator [Amycolatopsis acidiphila]
MRVVVDAGSGLAPWRQVQDQIIRLIARGALAPGTRLPPIRQLAGDLGLASGTIARVYRELEAAGWVVTARARGTVVAEAAARSDPAALLRAAAAEFATSAKELGADEEAAVAAVRAVWSPP